MDTINYRVLNANKLVSSLLLLIMAIAAPLGLNYLKAYSDQNFNSLLGPGLILFSVVAVLDLFVGITLRNVFASVNRVIANISMIIRILYACYLLVILTIVYLLPTESNNKFVLFYCSGITIL